MKELFSKDSEQGSGFSLKAFLRYFFCLDSLSSVVSAKEAYLITKYNPGVKINDSERAKEWIATSFDVINYKMHNGDFHCTRTIPEDLVYMKDSLISFIKEKGFSVVDLAELKLSSSRIILIQWDFDSTTSLEG